AGEKAEFTSGRVPPVADQDGPGRRGFLRKVAVVQLERAGNDLAGAVERQPGPQVDDAGDAPFDAVCRRALVDVDAAQQFGRHVGKSQGAAVVRGEGLASVELRANVSEAANDDAGAFDREVIGVDARGEAVDRDTRNALQRLGHRTVGQRADVFGRHRIDDGIAISLDVLGRDERLAEAGDYDRVLAQLLLCGGVLRQGRLRQASGRK